MFPAGQPLDHEPQMGQIVPMVPPPGTPPHQEGWLPPQFGRGPPLMSNGPGNGIPFMHHHNGGGDSPSMAAAMSHMASLGGGNPSDLMGGHPGGMMGGPPGPQHGMPGGPQDHHVDNDGPNYGEYSPMSMHKQVEVC